jgi:two-component system, NarL family, response regulator
MLIAGNYHYDNSNLIAVANEMPEINIMAIFETTENTLNHFSEYKPNVLFIDAFMSDISGVEISRMIKEQDRTVRIVIVSETYNREFYEIAADMQLNGYISKNLTSEKLKDMYRMLLTTGRCFPQPSAFTGD